MVAKVISNEIFFKQANVANLDLEILRKSKFTQFFLKINAIFPV